MMEKPSRILSGWRYPALILTLILSISGYFFMTVWGGWHKVAAAVETVGYATIALALTIACTSYFLRFLRWKYFLGELGYHLPFFLHLRLYISGFSLTITPAKAGETLRCLFLSDKGVAYRSSVGAQLAERFSDLIAVVILSIGGLAVYRDIWPVIVTTSIFIAFILYATQQQKWLLALERYLQKRVHNRFAESLAFILDTMLAFRACFRLKALIIGIGIGCFAWGLEGLILWLLLKAMAVPLPLVTAIFIQAFALLIGALSFLPGGLGGAEAVLYKLTVLNGIPQASAIAATVLLRLCTLWFSVGLGLLCLPKKRQSTK